MTQQDRLRDFSRNALALAVCAAFAGAQAQDKKAEEKSPVETQASIEVGVGAVSGDPKDRAFFGQYNGLRNQDVFGIANFDYSRRDTATGTWLDIIGSNLGLQTREVGVLWTRQGDWRLGGTYGELWRVNPYTVNTGVVGAGTVTPTANFLFGGAGSGGDYEPSTKRKAFGLMGSKWFGSQYQVEANITSEKKNGTQLWGIGNTCPATLDTCFGYGVLYYPQPIDYDHTQVEARVNYAGSSLQLSGGYYGSFFENNNGALTPGVPSILNSATGPLLSFGFAPPVALAPENQYNSIDLTGAYAITPMIRSNFKLAYSKARQDHDFSSMGLAGAPAGVGSLDGEVTHTLAQIRVVANPIAKLSLVGEYRYANQEDETPVLPYGQIGTTIYSNQRVSREVNNAKLEAAYRFPWAIQGTAGVGWNSIDRGSYTTSASYTGISALREETDETSWWIQVRRSMTETLSGLISYTGSSRDGSNWLAPAAGGVGLVAVGDPLSQLGANAIYMPTLADRDRSKLRLLLNWMATDALSVQFAIDSGRDE